MLTDIEWFDPCLWTWRNRPVWMYADYLHAYHALDCASGLSFYFQSFRLGADWGWWELISAN